MASKEIAVKQPGPALVPIEQYAILAEDPANMRQLIADNLGSGTLSPFDLEQIRVPAGGSTLWERASLDDPEADSEGLIHPKEIVGVVVYFRDVRAWWQLGYDEKVGAGSPPDCQSQDNINGIGTFGKGSAGNATGLCSNCPMAQWKSDRKGGPGQDCSQVRMLFLIAPDALLPMAVKVPPSSYKEARKFNITLAAKGIPVWAVITRLSLYKDKSAGGITYSKIRFDAQRVSKQMVDRLRVVRDAMAKAFDTMTIDVTDTRTVDADQDTVASNQGE